MSTKIIIISIVVVIAALSGIVTYTNIDELVQPSIETSMKTARNSISSVDGEDVIKTVDDTVMTASHAVSQIKVDNPLEP